MQAGLRLFFLPLHFLEAHHAQRPANAFNSRIIKEGVRKNFKPAPRPNDQSYSIALRTQASYKSSAPSPRKSAPGSSPNAPSTPFSGSAPWGAPTPNEAEPRRPINTRASSTPTPTAGDFSSRLTTPFSSYSPPNIAPNAFCWKNASDRRQLPPTSQKFGSDLNNKRSQQRKRLELSSSSQWPTPHPPTSTQETASTTSSGVSSMFLTNTDNIRTAPRTDSGYDLPATIYKSCKTQKGRNQPQLVS